VITGVQNAARYIGTRFAGMRLSRTAALGTVRNVVPAGIGGNGIVKRATGAPMA
jgi:hypothetical protein